MDNEQNAPEEMSVLDEALNVLYVLAGRIEPTRYRTYKLFQDEAAAILAHIDALKKSEATLAKLNSAKEERIAELEAVASRQEKIIRQYLEEPINISVLDIAELIELYLLAWKIIESTPDRDRAAKEANYERWTEPK